MRSKSKVAVAIALVFAGSIAGADAEDKCPAKRAQEAADMIEKVKSLGGYLMYFEKYKDCDDGAVSEDSSDKAAKIIISGWKDVAQLETISHDPAFAEFVYDHIDSTVSTDDLVKIRSLASRCGPGTVRICERLRRSVDRALH